MAPRVKQRSKTTIRDNTVTNIRSVIREAAKASGQSRREILRFAGMSQAEFARLMRRDARSSLHRLERLARALDLEIIIRPRVKEAAILSKPIERLGLSVRAHTCLTVYARKPVRTVRQLASCSEAMLAAIPNSGPTVVEQIRCALAQHGLRLKGEQ
jgi:transcriptional regulator with XRE-family HTH domain